MATSNFHAINAQSIYAITDEYVVDGQTYTRNEWDFQDLLCDIRYRGEEIGMTPTKAHNRQMDATELCETESQWETFGNGKAWTTETNVESVIVIRSGYYSGANLDYDIKVQTCEGDDFYLSGYEDVEDLLNDYMATLNDIVRWRGENHKWNEGTFKMQAKNIRKWVLNRITEEAEKCENFCKANCDVELRVSARFSNGETWYTKVG